MMVTSKSRSGNILNLWAKDYKIACGSPDFTSIIRRGVLEGMDGMSIEFSECEFRPNDTDKSPRGPPISRTTLRRS
jgi:hypothetical protein